MIIGRRNLTRCADHTPLSRQPSHVPLKHERNWFIQQLQHFAKMKRVRVSFLSGDVHCAAVGVLKTLAKGKKSALDPAVDHRYMINVVSSEWDLVSPVA